MEMIVTDFETTQRRRYGRTREAAAYMRFAPATLEKMRCQGSGPPYIVVHRTVIYDLDICDEWLAAQMRASTGSDNRESVVAETHAPLDKRGRTGCMSE